MYLIVLCMAGLTVALPVLPEPPNVSYSKAKYAYQNGEINKFTPNVDTAPSPVENNNKELEEYIVKSYPVSIPPPPELPPFDYSTLRKQYARRASSDNSVESYLKTFFKLKDMRPIDQNVEVIEKEFKPIENFKFKEKVPPMEDPKSEEAPECVMVPMCIEEHKPAEERRSLEKPVPIEPLYIDEPKSADESKSVEESIPFKELTNFKESTQEPTSVEEIVPLEELIYLEKPRPVEEPKTEDEPKSVEEPKFVDDPIPFKAPSNFKESVGEPTSIEEIIPLEELIYVEEPKSVEESKSIEEPKPIEEFKSVEEPKSVEHILVDSSKVETKEEPEKPLEDIPVVIQFSIPTTSFLSSIFSKLPSLSSFSWPFHIPSFFSRPRLTYPMYIDDEIYSY